MDQIKAELILHSPETIHKKVADIYYNNAITGKYPNEIMQVILRALHIPGKPNVPTLNL